MCVVSVVCVACVVCMTLYVCMCVCCVCVYVVCVACVAGVLSLALEMPKKNKNPTLRMLGNIHVFLDFPKIFQDV